MTWPVARSITKTFWGNENLTITWRTSKARQKIEHISYIGTNCIVTGKKTKISI